MPKENPKLLLKCLVVDDEHMARKLLEENIKQIPFLKHVASCKNAFEAMDALQNNQIDLMFLDIQMPGLIGTKFLSSLDKKPLSIFVTAYPQYALEGYELEAIDYLMKPLSMERFMKAVNKALKIHQDSLKIINLASVKDDNEGFFFINVEYSLVKVNINEINYIEGMKDYVKIYLTNNKKRLITKTTLASMEDKVQSGNFMRVHKSFIVNLDKVESIRNHQIKIEENEIPVSPNKLPELLESIGYKD